MNNKEGDGMDKFLSFRVRRGEVPSDALKKLDKKLAQVQLLLSNWITVLKGDCSPQLI